jgi:hypothetical protein
LVRLGGATSARTRQKSSLKLLRISKMKHGREQDRHPVPGNLDANTKQNERGYPDETVNCCRRHGLGQARRVGVAECRRIGLETKLPEINRGARGCRPRGSGPLLARSTLSRFNRSSSRASRSESAGSAKCSLARVAVVERRGPKAHGSERTATIGATS